MGPRQSREREDSLSVKLGNWFEAHATGRGVIAVPIVVLVVLVAVVAARAILLR
jgi:hypothetical protein